MTKGDRIITYPKIITDNMLKESFGMVAYAKRSRKTGEIPKGTVGFDPDRCIEYHKGRIKEHSYRIGGLGEDD